MRVYGLAGLMAVCAHAHAGSVFTTDYSAGSNQEAKARRGVEFRDAADPDLAWERFSFSELTRGFGDAAVALSSDYTEYKLNAINYNLYFGDELAFPFQIFVGDISGGAVDGANERMLLDPTQGLALQLPVAYRYRGGSEGGFCRFTKLQGYCVAGGDITLRGARLEEADAAGKRDDSFVFGASASLQASVLFPIFPDGVPGTVDQAGHLGASLGVRYYYNNLDDPQAVGQPVDPMVPAGAKDFGAFSAVSEFDIYQHLRLKIEYYYPFTDRSTLDGFARISIVVSPKQ